PVAVVWYSAGTRPGVVEIDPVVRERLLLGRHQRDEDEIAVPQAPGRSLDLGRCRRLEAQNEIAERNARDDRVDAVLVEISIRLNGDTLDVPIGVPYGDAPVIEVREHAPV